MKSEIVIYMRNEHLCAETRDLPLPLAGLLVEAHRNCEFNISPELSPQ